MMFLLGKQAIFGHDPPMYLRSISATRCPWPAKVQAAMVDPVPPPRMTRSNSSGCVLSILFFVGFMRFFLSGVSLNSDVLFEVRRSFAAIRLALISLGLFRPPSGENRCKFTATISRQYGSV